MNASTRARPSSSGSWTGGDFMRYDDALTMALETVAPQAKWQNTVVALGSVIAHTAVLLVFQLGQPRIFFSMARDAVEQFIAGTDRV